MREPRYAYGCPEVICGDAPADVARFLASATKPHPQRPGTWEPHGWGMMEPSPGRRQKRSHYWRRCRPRFNPVFWESLCGERITYHTPLPEDVCGRCVKCDALANLGDDVTVAESAEGEEGK